MPDFDIWYSASICFLPLIFYPPSCWWWYKSSSRVQLEVPVLEIKTLNSQRFWFFPLFLSAPNPVFELEKWEELQWCFSVLQLHCILINLRLSLLGFVIHSSRWIQTQRNETPNVLFDGNLLLSFCTGNAYLNNKNWILLFSECHLLFKSYKAGSGDLLLSPVLWVCKITVNTCEHFLRFYLFWK